MSIIFHDPDEWETVCHSEGEPPFASFGMIMRRRPPEEASQLKAERCRRAQDEILARADRIRAERAAA